MKVIPKFSKLKLSRKILFVNLIVLLPVVLVAMLFIVLETNWVYHNAVQSINDQKELNVLALLRQSLIAERNTILFTLAAVVALYVAIMMVSIRHFVLAPIKQLQSAAQEFSKGNLEQKIELSTEDELGELARIFNAMNAEISQAQVYLKRKVEKMTKKATEAAEKVEIILSAVGEAIISIDTQGEVVAFNKAAEKIFGYSEAEVVGQNVKMLMPQATASQHDEYLQEADVSKGSPIFGRERVLEAQRKNGECFPIGLTVTKGGDSKRTLLIGVIVDLTEKTKRELELAEKDALIQTAIDASVQPFLLLDDKWNFIEVNQSACDWLGYSRDRLLSMNIEAITAKDSLEWTKASIKRLEKGEVPRVVGEKLYIRSDGIYVWGLLSVAPVSRRDGTVLFYVSQITDIQEQKDLEQVLEQRNLDLLKSNEDLDEFAYVASHDLKSPLNAIVKIVGWLEEDAGDQLPESALEHLALLKNRTQRMMRLLNDLLEYSRIGRKQFEEGIVELQVLTEDIFSILDKPEGFRLESDSIMLTVPRTPLELVLRNLISNAIKHHDKDAGLIEVRCEYDGGCYQIRVQDDGPGIPPELNHKVVEMFQTLKPRDQVEGSGMGLAMVKKTVEHYGGTLEIISDGVRGTCFHISWPVSNPVL